MINSWFPGFRISFKVGVTVPKGNGVYEPIPWAKRRDKVPEFPRKKLALIVIVGVPNY
jgi:hypothetical protein